VPEPQRRSPLEGVLAPGHYGAEPPDGPGITIALRRGLALLQVMARRGAEPHVAQQLGLDPTPGRASGVAAGTALWLAPGAWMIVAEGRDGGAPHQSLREDLRELAAVVDQSHGRAVLRLSGARARDVLAKGCRLDLHPRVFQPGMCAQTAIAQVGVLLHQVDERPTYDLYVSAGYAVHFLEWLTSCAAEIGCRIDGP
jgi:methylglutamate dehydrogenase subunit D